jgi:pyruvate dehydrogenase E2 component (dihydrolipoamide acetyltransferase)
MAIVVTLPDLGENIKEGELTAVLVKPGDQVRADQPAVELETDKAVVEVPAGRSGRVLELLARPGERVAVGAALFSLEEVAGEGSAILAVIPAQAGTSFPLPEPPAPPAPLETNIPPAPSAPAPFTPSTAEAQLPVPASPTVRRLARELGVEIRAVAGSGPGGRVSREDVKAHVKRLLETRGNGEIPAFAGMSAAEALPDFSRWGPVEELPLSGVRRATALHLAAAWPRTPRVTQFDKADVTELEAFRLRRQRELERRADAPRLTMTAILIRVLAQALRAFPQFNASLDLGRETVIRKGYCHVGVAVDTERGLLVPVIRDADGKGVLALAAELAELSARARERKSPPEELQGACITLTNLGGIGGTAFTPVVNLPEAAILGVSRAAREPVWNEEQGAFAPRLMLPLSLSYDHRLIDGADAARFTRWICEALESPLLLVM